MWLPICVASALFPLENYLCLWEVLRFLQDLWNESVVFPHQELGGKGRDMVALELVHVFKVVETVILESGAFVPCQKHANNQAQP